jgi:hypothetical protein
MMVLAWMTICVKALIKAITHSMALMCECTNFLVWLTFMIIITTCLFSQKKTPNGYLMIVVFFAIDDNPKILNP